MAVNFSDQLYRLCQDVFSVPCTFNPIWSQPNGSSYAARGIFHKRDLDIVAEDGSIFSDHQLTFDIRTIEFAILPVQKDRVMIPFDSSGEPLGEYEITDTALNGGGEMTLVIRRYESPRP